MRALIYRGRGKIKVEDVEEPQVKPGWVKLKVNWCGICGTDLHELLDGPVFFPEGNPHPLTMQTLPLPMGHEMSGTIVDVGEGCKKFKQTDKGVRVAVEPVIRDNTCYMCKEGSYNLCEKMGFYGLSGWGGGLSEYIIVKEENAFVLPDNVPSDIGALCEPLSVVWYAMKHADWKPGMSALIVGGGPIGLAMALVLKANGAKWIALSEVAKARKDQAAKFVDRVIDPTQEDVVKICKEQCDGLGPHVAFDCCGIEASVKTIIAAVRPKGIAFNVAIWEKPVNVDVQLLTMGDKTYRASIGTCGIFQEVVDSLANGSVQPRDLITKRVKLEDVVDEGFYDLIKNKDKHIKILVEP